MKWLWRAFAGTAVLTLSLGVASSVWFSFFFDPEVHRDRLVTWVTDRAGTRFILDGELAVDLKFSGRSSALRISLSDLAFENQPGFAGQEIFRASRLRVEIPIWHLLKGNIYPNVTVRRPEVHLIRRDSERTNWQHLEASIGIRSKAIHEWDLIQGLAAMAVTGLRVLDGTVHWVREDTGHQTKISNIEFEMSSLIGGQPSFLETHMVFEGNMFKKPTAIDAAVTIEREPQSGLIRGEGMEFNIVTPGAFATFNAREIDGDLKNQSVELRNAAVTGAVGSNEFHLAVEAAQYLKVTDRLTATAVDGKWIGAGMEADADMTSIFVRSVRADVISPVREWRMDDRFGRWQRAAKIASEVAGGSGKVVFSVFDWNRLLATVGISMSVERWAPLAFIHGMVDMSFGKQGIEIHHFDLNWNESKLEGSLFKLPSREPRLEFNLAEDLLDASGTLTFKFDTAGIDKSLWPEKSRGKAAVRIREGRIRKFGHIRVFGTEIGQYIRQARTAMGMEAEWVDIEGGIPFSNLETTLIVRDGEIRIDDFAVEALGLKFLGRGKYLLLSEEFNSLWHVSWEKPIEGSGLTLLSQLQTMVVPFRVAGRGKSLSVALDIPELLRILSE